MISYQEKRSFELRNADLLHREARLQALGGTTAELDKRKAALDVQKEALRQRDHRQPNVCKSILQFKLENSY